MIGSPSSIRNPIKELLVSLGKFYNLVDYLSKGQNPYKPSKRKGDIFSKQTDTLLCLYSSQAFYVSVQIHCIIGPSGCKYTLPKRIV